MIVSDFLAILARIPEDVPPSVRTRTVGVTGTWDGVADNSIADVYEKEGRVFLVLTPEDGRRVLDSSQLTSLLSGFPGEMGVLAVDEADKNAYFPYDELAMADNDWGISLIARRRS